MGKIAGRRDGKKVDLLGDGEAATSTVVSGGKAVPPTFFPDVVADREVALRKDSESAEDTEKRLAKADKVEPDPADFAPVRV